MGCRHLSLPQMPGLASRSTSHMRSWKRKKWLQCLTSEPKHSSKPLPSVLTNTSSERTTLGLTSGIMLGMMVNTKLRVFGIY